mmetsp:Transcript_19618/g.27020  ORF Transcript_19618/g.27020 Transcript_19618/m.27020 type:complete len:283 (+) Transcript_19618:44-892(+)
MGGGLVFVFFFFLVVLDQGKGAPGPYTFGLPDYPQKEFEWMGHEWTVRYARFKKHPGPNFWGHSERSVWVDGDGFLNLRAYPMPATKFWLCAEVILVPSGPFGYGTFEWTTSSPLHQLDDNFIGSLMLTQGLDRKNIHSDVKTNSSIQQATISWTRSFEGDPNDVSFSLSPKYSPKTKNHRSINFSLGDTSPQSQAKHQIHWNKGNITFALEYQNQRETWSYFGEDHFDPDEVRVHMNLWLKGGVIPTDNKPFNLTFNSFLFTPNNTLLWEQNSSGSEDKHV